MKSGRKTRLKITTMQQLIELMKRCASTASSAQPRDLSTLVQLHSDLLTARLMTVGEGQGAGGEVLSKFADATQQTALLVEKMILSRVDDAQGTLGEVTRQVNELLGLLSPQSDAVWEIEAEPKTAVVAEARKAPGFAEAETEQERDIGDDRAPYALDFVGEAMGHLDAAEASLLKLEDDAADLDEVNAVFRAFHSIKGGAGFMEFKQVGALAHATEAILHLARKGKMQITGRTLDVVLEARDMMWQMVGEVEAAAKVRRAPARQDGLREMIARLEAAASGNQMAAPAASVAKEIPERTEAPAQAGDGVIKVATVRLDTLIDSVGELVIAQAMVSQDLISGATISEPRLARNLSQLGKITRGLQELSMSMRMVPIAGVFQKMARLARDVARKAGKEVEFSQAGAETELDRNVVEAVSDPLVHMIRNAIDHGLESPEERARAGKASAGRLVLKAFHQSGNVVIEISDDGRGMNQRKIVQKAVAAGLVREGQDLSEQDIFQLVFHPGLTTAENVTEISGRGVGMDVVRRNVEALRGRIEIASTGGQGSTFTVRLPLTLAVIDGLVVKVGVQRYIIPITAVQQNIRPVAAQLSTVSGKGEMCMVRNRLLPIARLHRMFNVAANDEDATRGILVVVQDGARHCCMLVDELVGQQQVVIKSMGKEMGNLPGVAGCAILGDGNVSLILDVAGIIQTAMR